MVKCAVPSCQHDSRKHNKKKNNITFHRFPKNPKIANKWVKAIRRPNWEPNIRSSYVCSVHFNPASISETKQGYRMLICGAVPELHIPDQSDPLYGVPSYNELMVVDDEDCTQNYEENTRNTQINDQTPENINKESSSSSKMVLVKNCLLEPSYTPREMKLKRQILRLRDVANRRRLRCNALHSEISRYKKKVSNLNALLAELRRKDLEQEQKSEKKEKDLVELERKSIKKEEKPVE